MNAKLQEYFKSRLPLVIRKRDEYIYFQLQIDIARNDGLRAGKYIETEKIKFEGNPELIGKVAKDMILRFHELGDLSVEDFKRITREDEIDAYEKEEYFRRLKFFGAENEEELSNKYDKCFIEYMLFENKYSFALAWAYNEGKRFFLDDSPSTGKKGILTFDNALEFYDDVLPEQLGEMIMEAFERSNKMAAAMSRGTLPDKEIDLLEGTIVTVTPPKDKHFVDNEDAGVGEIYQDYAYIAKEDAESSADFMLTVAPELYEELSCDNIRLAWIEAFGEAEEISVTETEYGIFSYRAELKNKKMYRIAYFRELNDGTAVECCMEIPNPSKKKRLTEKLPNLFEQFAGKCRI